MPYRKPSGRESWVSFEDVMFDHPRWSDLSHADQDKALPFVFRAVSYCHAHNTDGVVPRSKFGAVFGEKLAAKLALKRGWKLCWQIGVFEDDPRGLFVHDYLDYQIGSDQRESASQRGKTLNEQRWHGDPVTDSANGGAPDSSTGHAAASSNGIRNFAKVEVEEKKTNPLRPPVENLARRRQRKPRGMTADEIRHMATTHTQERTHP